MSRSHLAAAALAALVFLPAARADDPPAAAPAPAPLKFGWTVPSKATVTEKMFRHGIVVTTRYAASLERAGDDLKLRFHDLEVVDVAGRKPDDPSVAPLVANIVRMSKVTPGLLIGAGGAVKEVVDLDVAIAAAIEELEKGKTDAEKAEAQARREQSKAPEAREAMKRESMKPWQAWVGEWIGLSLAEGASLEGKHSVRDVDGTEREAPSVVRRAASTEGAGLTLLTRETTLEGDATKASLDAWIKAVSAQTGQSPPEFTGLTLTSRSMVVTDPATLRPTRSVREDACVAHVKDRKDIVVALDRHEYAFEWPADAPKAPASDK